MPCVYMLFHNMPNRMFSTEHPFNNLRMKIIHLPYHRIILVINYWEFWFALLEPLPKPHLQ